jgi:acyl carrier protein
MEDAKEKIKQCFENLGILIESDENFLIADYIASSIVYISLLVELENMFSLEIPDEYLVQGRLVTYQDLCNMMTDLVCL